MDSCSRLSFLCFSFFILFIRSSFPAIASASASGPLLRSFSDDDKVSLELYYESLCPYSANFIVNYLNKLFDDGLISIVDLKLVPYGNARIGANDSITCQHGPAECLLNTVEACAIDAWPELNDHFPFIYSIEALVYERKYSQWESCFQKLDLNSKPIFDCYTTGYGKELELKYAALTSSLQPPHQYVPWVVVDGKPLYEDYENFISYICEAYNGTSVPSACSKSTIIQGVPRVGPFDRVCYKEESIALTLYSRITSTVASWIRHLKMG